VVFIAISLVIQDQISAIDPNHPSPLMVSRAALRFRSSKAFERLDGIIQWHSGGMGQTRPARRNMPIPSGWRDPSSGIETACPELRNGLLKLPWFREQKSGNQ
jgi:hypothetical protein